LTTTCQCISAEIQPADDEHTTLLLLERILEQARRNEWRQLAGRNLAFQSGSHIAKVRVGSKISVNGLFCESVKPLSILFRTSANEITVAFTHLEQILDAFPNCFHTGSFTS